MSSLKFWTWFSYGEKRPAFLEFRSSRGFIVTAMSLAVFTDIFLYGLVVPVFPFALEKRANIPHDDVQRWVSVLLAVYGAGLFIASPVCGYLADISSNRRSSLLFGLLALTGATVLLCVGSNITVLIIGRFLQGVSAAIIWTVGLALIADTVGKGEVAQSMGIVSVAMSGGIFLAPLLGGIVYDKGGYYAVFSIAFGLLALDIFIRLILIEQKIAAKYLPKEVESGESSPGTDSSGMFPGKEKSSESPPGSPHTPKSPGEGSDLMPISKAQTPHNWESPADNHNKNTSNDIEAGPIIVKKRSRVPPIIRILKYPRLLTALWGTLVQAVLMTTLETTLPLRARELFNFNATGAGLIFLATVLPTFLAPLVGWACDKWGTRWVQTAGFILCCPFFVFLRFPDHNSVSQIVLMCAILALIGIGLVLIMPTVMAEISLFLNEVEENNPGIFGSNGAYAQGYGLFNVAFSAGTFVGPLWSGFLKDAVGWNTMVWTIGVLSIFTAIPSTIYTGGKIRKEDITFMRRSA
ncbi:MFS general substrate transporter [Choiromyces venosus 120613-1]|uniref:MFS general substrate transporter n=1 Tax=Choiromyces venosus 120613-1 TaxID=1336337 RepID=A0A3N4JUZ8_9PEZI|nr:MFS general substrate transporter [Choiromyces venosus 120613-1]